MSMEPNEQERSEPAVFVAESSDGAASGAAGAQANGGTGQRRRRRRRKNRGGAGGGANAVAGQGQAQATGEDGAEGGMPATEPSEARAEGEPSPQAAAPAQNGDNGQFRHGRRGRDNNGGGGQQFANNGGGGGKKKHWQNKGQGGQNGGGQQFSNGGAPRENRPYPKQNREYNPGNSIYGPGGGAGGRRKGKKGRGPGAFVGPMDHSYRAPNGNIADRPSGDYRREREVNGNVVGLNGYYDELDMYMPVVPAREDAPVRVILFVEDLFVVAKTQETARKLGIKVQFAKAEKDVLQSILDTPEQGRPSLIVFDLNNANAKPLTTIPKLKAKLKRGTSIIGFLSQIQGDLKVKATEAGCDMVMHKGAFSQNLPTLLRRHGIEDEEFETVEA